jgi:hypothetical protein
MDKNSTENENVFEKPTIIYTEPIMNKIWIGRPYLGNLFILDMFSPHLFLCYMQIEDPSLLTGISLNNCLVYSCFI